MKNGTGSFFTILHKKYNLGYPKNRVTFFMKKIFLRILLLIFLFTILAYVTNITAIPNSIILFQGEKLNLGTIFGITLIEDYEGLETIETIATIENNSKVEVKKIKLSLFNILDVKEVEVNTIPKAYIVPLGNSIGLKLYTSGVLVVGMTEIEGKKPYQNSGIQDRDMIVEVNKEEVNCTAELINSVNNSNGENIDVKYIRDGKEYISTIAPIKTKNNEYKLGLWVRDRSSRNRNINIL